MKNKKIIITGNHHTPAIELIYQLKSDTSFNWQIYYITHQTSQETHVENSLTTLLGKNIFQIDSSKFYRYSLLKTLKNIPKIFSSLYKTYKLIKQINPDIIVSFGGYTSVPVIFLAWISRIPSLTHEQTSNLSLSNFINGFFVKKICLSFKNNPVNFFKNKFHLTGNLLRRQIFSLNTKNYQYLNQIIKTKPLLYVSGGNQSSDFINKTFLKIIPLLKNYTIIHHVGKLKYPKIIHPSYLQTSYVGIDDIGWVLNSSHLIINRAGANYCQEIVTLAKNCILIPLPISAKNEQIRNATWVKVKQPKKTIILNQALLTPDMLIKAIQSFKFTKSAKQIKPTINYSILKLIHLYV